VVEILEISRVRRRPRPLKELDGRARAARLRVEKQIFREPLIPLLLKFPEDQLQQIEDERRVAAYGAVPSRAALIRQLIVEGLMWRRSMRPKSPPRAPKGVPFVGLEDWPNN
jgi:hypothetical protein